MALSSSLIRLCSTMAVSSAWTWARERSRTFWQTCQPAWFDVDAFAAQGVHILERCCNARGSNLRGETVFFLHWYTCLELTAWLDKAPRRALTPLVWQLWGQLLSMDIQQTLSRKDEVPEEMYGRLLTYLSFMSILEVKQWMVGVPCEEGLDGPSTPVVDALVQILGLFSKPEPDRYQASPLLSHLVVVHGWDPRALLAKLGELEGLRPKGAINLRCQLLRNLLPLLLETDWKPPPSEVFAGFWEAHQRTRWGHMRKYELAMRDKILHRLHEVFPEHRLHAVAFVARTQETFEAESIACIFPLFEGRVQDQNHGRILEVSCHMLPILAKERAGKAQPFADCLREHHCEWATIFDMHFLLCGSIPCALESQVELLRAVAGFLDGGAVGPATATHREMLDIQATPGLFSA